MESSRLRDRLAQLVSSDEAPDTGDDSDEDLITSYLGGAGNGGPPSSSDHLVPAIHVTPQSPNANHVLEDNLLQLSRIQEKIQLLRASNATGDGGLHGGQNSSRLSTSCPSLNNSTDAAILLDPDQTPPSTTTDNSSASNHHHLHHHHHHDRNQNFSQNGQKSASSGHRRRKNNNNSNGNETGGTGSDKSKSSHRKRPTHRSMSVSSGDSEDEGMDCVDATAAAKARQRSASTAAPKDTKTPSPSVYKDSMYQRFIHGGASRHKSPHLMLPGLQKSVSTPSIVVDPVGSKSGKSSREFPEPTHVFLQRLIAEHDWTRQSGSDSDSDGPSSDFVASDGLVSGRHIFGNASSSMNNAGLLQQHHQQQQQQQLLQQNASIRSRQHPVVGPHNSTPSPQLSLAEFLQDDPNLEDDDSRKRRRKKERSSLFFRKKKDKGVNSANGSSGSGGKSSVPPTIQHHALFDAGQFYHMQQQMQQKGLSKVSSSINLGSKSSGNNNNSSASSVTSRMPQHSYSMSSLRKPSVSGPNSGGQNAAGAATAPPFPGGVPTSNFYLARGELNKPYEDREDIGHEDTAGLLEGEFVPGEEFSEGGGPAAIRDLETPRHLKIEEEEPETWTHTVSPSVLGELSSADVKRQEHMYEFVLTESNHCQVLKVIQKIFVEGMYKYLNLSKEIVERIFPCIDTLIDLHFRFLEELRAKQNLHPVMDSIADILHSQFSGENGARWTEAYGSFCSGHNEAVSVFKDLMKSDRRFQQFVKQCSENPLLKKKGVPECILFVTTRITKYPLLIEPLIKAATRDRPAEMEMLKQANTFVRDILKEVNAKVAEKERKQRLFEIYNRVDPKSTLHHNGRKFKKSDILLSDRRLMFEGVAILQQARNRTLQVNVIVLSDILFFLHENNQKFYFISPDNKPSIVPVKTLIARERSGGSTKSLYLISTEGSESEPEMYDLEIMQPPTRDDWISGIRVAVDSAMPGSDSDSQEDCDEDGRRKRVDWKYMKMRRLAAELRGKDIELSQVLSAKMKIMHDMMEVASGAKYPDFAEPDYIGLVREKKASDSPQEITKEELLSAVQEASRLACSLYTSATNLSRSVSCVGERHSNEYSSPSLPRRAETFGGFDKEGGDNGKRMQAQEIDIGDGGEREIAITNQEPAKKSAAASQQLQQPVIATLAPEQQQAAIQMTHYINMLMCMVSEHFTSLESIKAQLNEIREKATISGGRYKQNQKFEEMRALQASLAEEKKSWHTERNTLDIEIETKRAEMQKHQSEIERGLKDVKEQREQLYRKLEVLRAQGIELGPNLSVLKTDLKRDQQQQSERGSSGGDVLFYSEVNPSSSSTSSSSPQHTNSANNILLASSTSSANLQPSSSSASSSSSGIRKSSSLTSSSAIMLARERDQMQSANTLATGGSLKKESLANLHLMSATNESKALERLDKQEIKQQIPVKLSCLSKDKGSKKGTTPMGSNSSSASITSSSNKGIGNLAKPETVQQLLPFKLSETSSSTPGESNSSRVSSKPPSKLSSSSFQQQQQQQQQQYSPNQGSFRYSAAAAASAAPNNTLPKSMQKVTYSTNSSSTSGGGGNNGASGANNSDEDKVIYF